MHEDYWSLPGVGGALVEIVERPFSEDLEAVWSERIELAVHPFRDPNLLVSHESRAIWDLVRSE